MLRLITTIFFLHIVGLQTLCAQYPLDKSFGDDGMLGIYRAEDMIVLSNGNILLFDSKDPDAHVIYVYGFDADGNALNRFGEHGVLKLEFENPTDCKMAIAADHNEWYLWLNDYTYSNALDSIIRFNEHGERIKEYGINGAAVLPAQEYYTPGNMLVTRSGELMVTGELEALFPDTDGRFVYKFTREGLPDMQFGDAGLVMVNDDDTYSAGRSLFVERSDGGILVGNTVSPGSYSITEVALLNKWGVPDTSFGKDGIAKLSAMTNESVLYSFWYDEQSEVVYLLTYGSYLGDVRVWQLNWDGELNILFGLNGYKKNEALNGALTMYKLSDGTFFFTGIEFINPYFQWDAAVWRTSPDITILPWPSDDLIPSMNIYETEDLLVATDDRELRSVMHTDGSILVLVAAKFYNGNGEGFPSAVLMKLDVSEQPRPDMCPLLSVPVLSADEASSSFLLTLDPQASGSFTFSVTDMLGRTVVPHNTIDLAPGIAHYTYPIPQDLPKGMYLLTIHADDCATGIKFIK